MKTEISDWDASEYLDSPEMIKEYIDAAIEEGNSELLQAALDDVAKAQGATGEGENMSTLYEYNTMKSKDKLRFARGTP